MNKKTMINPGWEAYKRLTFAPAVRKGNMLFISGTDATQVDPATGKLIVRGDMVEQTTVIYEKLKAILEAAGATFEDVVWTTDYITTKENYRATAEVRRQYFGESFPASTGIIVKSLLSEGALIEIDAVALLD
ncbi:MAG: RidA family protein [Desulfobacteraceae bacterium]|nr:RidA family protein [Desulfobacteraceae bacterium]